MTVQLVPFPAAEYGAWRSRQVERRRRWQFAPLWSDADAAHARARAAVDDLAPADGLSGTYLMRVLGGDGEAGWLWLTRQGGDLLVLDAEMAEPEETAAEVLGLLVHHARGGNASYLVLDRMVAAPTMAALAKAGEFRVESQTMALDLTRDAPAGPAAARDVELRPMTQDTFDAYLDAAVGEYARELQRTDDLPWDRALDRSRADYDTLLPSGLASPGQVLLDVVDLATGANVGAMWLGMRPPSAAFVNDLYILSPHRGEGLGRAAMLAALDWCRHQEIDVLGLTVFRRNTVARHLYRSLGFTAVMQVLRSPVPPAPPVAGPR